MSDVVTMDARRGDLLALVASVAPGAFLWRGEPAEATSDVDIALPRGARAAVDAALAAEGLTRVPSEEGRTVWREGDLALDLWPAEHWPRRYPSVEELAARAEAGARLPVAAAPDRALIYAIDAVAGRPLVKLAPKAASAGPPRPDDRALASLAHELPDMPAGYLSYSRALATAVRSHHARAALAHRVTASARRIARERLGRSGIHVALSGMDGSGKSTVATALCEHLRASGFEAETHWVRLGNQGELLDRVARPVKRFLGANATVADPVAAGGPELEAKDTGRRRGGPLAWAWILFVTTTAARTQRRATRPLRRGHSVVCDRWLADALVDLELRYGSQGAARALLRKALPQPDLAILLRIDGATSAKRKPGDQAERYLVQMERLYDDAAREQRLVVVDARAPLERVLADLEPLVDELTQRRGRPRQASSARS
ncbi:MAG: hypothetical protein QOJ29_2222 [Thermoleophilaceae bacterium]|jgi:thymidylate kinase|nr:hypothetical protein [Thermoleophilaceae bacterium]